MKKYISQIESLINEEISSFEKKIDNKYFNVEHYYKIEINGGLFDFENQGIKVSFEKSLHNNLGDKKSYLMIYIKYVGEKEDILMYDIRVNDYFFKTTYTRQDASTNYLKEDIGIINLTKFDHFIISEFISKSLVTKGVFYTVTDKFFKNYILEKIHIDYRELLKDINNIKNYRKAKDHLFEKPSVFINSKKLNVWNEIRRAPGKDDRSYEEEILELELIVNSNDKELQEKAKTQWAIDFEQIKSKRRGRDYSARLGNHLEQVDLMHTKAINDALNEHHYNDSNTRFYNFENTECVMLAFTFLFKCDLKYLIETQPFSVFSFIGNLKAIISLEYFLNDIPNYFNLHKFFNLPQNPNSFRKKHENLISPPIFRALSEFYDLEILRNDFRNYFINADLRDNQDLVINLISYLENSKAKLF